MKKTTVHYTTTGTNRHINRGVPCISKTVGHGKFRHVGHLSDEKAKELAAQHCARRNPNDFVSSILVSRITI